MEKGILFTFISQMYLQHCKDVGMTAQTLQCKKSVIDSQLNPYFQSYFIEDITEEDVVRFKKHLLKQNFSKEYNIHIVSTLSCIFRFCVRSNYIPKNVCGYSTIFKEINRCSFWSKEEFSSFISYFDNNLMFKTFYSILFTTNLTHSEIRSLTIEDIDLSNLTISIHQKFVRKKDNKKGVREKIKPICDKDRRMVSISEDIGVLLKQYIFSNHFDVDDVLFPIKCTEVFQKERESCDFNHLKEIYIHSQKNKKNKYII